MLLSDFWETFERLLRGFWETFERLLRDFWEAFERLLRGFWETFEQLGHDGPLTWPTVRCGVWHGWKLWAYCHAGTKAKFWPFGWTGRREETPQTKVAKPYVVCKNISFPNTAVLLSKQLYLQIIQMPIIRNMATFNVAHVKSNIKYPHWWCGAPPFLYV